jgi:hypothetical protein
MYRAFAAAMAIGLGFVHSAQARESTAYPRVVQTNHASPVTAHLFEAFFTAKCAHDVDKTMGFFAPDMVSYTDATLGWPMQTFEALKGVFANYMPKWPATGLSYPVRILGGKQSALVDFIDTKELFGSELHVLAAVDIKDGKIVRWIDYWDGDSFDATAYGQERTASDKFPRDFQEHKVGEDASVRIRDVSVKLQRALSKADAGAAAALFSSEAVYEDRTLKTEILGSAAIQRYLVRVLASAPFGQDATLRHVVGGNLGGGFEWVGGPSSGELSGVTALELNGDGKITRLTVVYDGRQLAADSLAKFAALSLER